MAQWIRHRMAVIIGQMILQFSHYGTITKSRSSYTYFWKNSLPCFTLTKFLRFGEKWELSDNLSYMYFLNSEQSEEFLFLRGIRRSRVVLGGSHVFVGFCKKSCLKCYWIWLRYWKSGFRVKPDRLNTSFFGQRHLIGVVYLVPETGNLALAEPGAM